MAPVPPAPVAAGERPVPKTVLIAEDNALNRRLFADVLAEAGYRVQEAADGNAALAAARSAPPALLLLDIDLPDLSGLVVAQRLCAELADAAPVIIAVSGHPAAMMAGRVMESGCDAWLAKPVRPDALTAAVRRHIGMPV